jgi:hypothetical protein
MSTIMPAFVRFPQEGAIIGRLLAGYGELELGLCFCVAEARNDHNMVFKAMFRPRGESQRIDVADAMGHEPYNAVKLGTHFEGAIGAIRYCLKIRNQYAHSYWTDNFGRCLAFAQLEEPARGKDPVLNVGNIGTKDIDLATLQAQESFFMHTQARFDYLKTEIKVRAGKLPESVFEAPKPINRPPLCKP